MTSRISAALFAAFLLFAACSLAIAGDGGRVSRDHAMLTYTLNLIGRGRVKPAPAPAPIPPDLAVPEQLLMLHNRERAKAGKPALAMSTSLAKAAQEHAERMAAGGRIGHAGFPARVYTSGYTGQAVGENVAAGFVEPAAVMAVWLQSRGHRVNLLNSSAIECGFGTAKSPRGEVYWCAIFGRSRPPDGTCYGNQVRHACDRTCGHRSAAWSDTIRAAGGTRISRESASRGVTSEATILSRL